MAAWLLNLGFAGGQAQDSLFARYTLFVKPVIDTFVVKDTQERMDVYKDPKSANKTLIKLDWADWLAPNSSSISSVSWDTSNSGITVSDTSNTTTTATAYLSGGTEGSDYEVYCTITTDDSVARTETRTIRVFVNKLRA